jgi:aminopeptidase N
VKSVIDPLTLADIFQWWVPLGLRGRLAPNGKPVAEEVTPIAFTKKEDIIVQVDDLFYKLNADNAGFYRINYPPARLAKLGTQVDRLSLSDKIGLIGDAGALALSGEASTRSLLELAKGFKSETSHLVWSQLLGSLGTVKSVFSDDEVIAEGLRKFTVDLISPAVAKIGES